MRRKALTTPEALLGLTGPGTAGPPARLPPASEAEVARAQARANHALKTVMGGPRPRGKKIADAVRYGKRVGAKGLVPPIEKIMRSGYHRDEAALAHETAAVFALQRGMRV